jgi:hypothetical protein
MSAVLGGRELLVFTNGLGENDAEVRASSPRSAFVDGVILEDSCNRAASDPLAVRDPVSRYACGLSGRRGDSPPNVDAMRMPFPAAQPIIRIGTPFKRQ